MTQTSIIIAYVTTQDFPALRASVFGFEFGLGYSVLGFGLTERAHTERSNYRPLTASHSSFLPLRALSLSLSPSFHRSPPCALDHRTDSAQLQPSSMAATELNDALMRSMATAKVFASKVRLLPTRSCVSPGGIFS